MEAQGKKSLGWVRKKLLINEHFQLRFIAFCGGTALVACAFFYAASTYFFAQYTGYAIEAGLRPSDPFFKVLYNMENLLTYIFAFAAVGVMGFTVIVGLVFSNKVAGPMYRLRQHCEKVARGETLDDVTFRKNDYFDDVATAYNFQMKTIRERLGSAHMPPQVDGNIEMAVPEEIKKAG